MKTIETIHILGTGVVTRQTRIPPQITLHLTQGDGFNYENDGNLEIILKNGSRESERKLMRLK